MTSYKTETDRTYKKMNMKKNIPVRIFAAVMVCLIAFSSFVSCSDDNKQPLDIDIEQTALEFSQKLKFDEVPARLDDQIVQTGYSFDGAEQTVVYTGSGSTAEEIIICRAKDKNTETAENIEKQLGAYLKDRINIYTDYNSGELPKLENAYLKSVDGYAFLIVCADYDNAEAAAEEILKK